MKDYSIHPASYKDPSGFVFLSKGTIYRQVNQRYANVYDHLMSSGLYEKLIRERSLIPHQEVEENVTGEINSYKTIQPEKIEFISYPYEWCFEELRDAALLTLKILKLSLDHGMILKDATPYNIQLHRGAPVFIDTLSFEIYNPSQPWVAYRQFCKNFLFPLYLEHYLNSDIQKIMMAYMDGIPVDLTSKLLPVKSGLNLGVWLHVYLQNSVRGNDKGGKENTGFNKRKLLNLVSHLEGIIQGFQSKTGKSVWSNYYDETILGQDYLREKESIFRHFLTSVSAKNALDLGANDGYFTKILSAHNISVVATDTDSRSISKLYSYIRNHKTENIHPIVLDIANPSPALGFNNKERQSFHDRVKPDLVLALALTHHLVIGNNMNLSMLAKYFAGFAPQLIIEFVPKADEKVQQMLATRDDVFDDYHQQGFEESFLHYFSIIGSTDIPGTTRTMYLMRRITN